MLGALGGLPPSKVAGSGGRSPPALIAHPISQYSFLISLGGIFHGRIEQESRFLEVDKDIKTRLLECEAVPKARRPETIR